MIRNISCVRFTIIIIRLLQSVPNRKPHFLDIILCASDSANAKDLIGILQYFGDLPNEWCPCVLHINCKYVVYFTPLSSLAKIRDGLQFHVSSQRDNEANVLSLSPSSEPFTLTKSYERSKHQLLFIKLINFFDTKF